MKTVKAVPPISYKSLCNFKSYPYFEWEKQGFPVAKAHYPHRLLHGLAYRFKLPIFYKRCKEARLRFVSGYSIWLDTFPDYAFYEIIPVIWDCWPLNRSNVELFINKCKVETAIFTSSQTADFFRNLFPHLNVITISEGVDLSLYSRGKDLQDRNIDILEVGRGWVNFFKTPLKAGINHIKTGNASRIYNSDDEFRKALADTKVSINVPRCDVDSETAGNIETLTQRYWECMLSRIVMVGRAPQELIDLIGYNPVITWNGEDAAPIVNSILSNINDYQTLVDRNYETAREMASWNIRINEISAFLKNNGYQV